MSLSVADEYYYMMVSLTDELRTLQAHLLAMIRLVNVGSNFIALLLLEKIYIMQFVQYMKYHQEYVFYIQMTIFCRALTDFISY